MQPNKMKYEDVLQLFAKSNEVIEVRAIGLNPKGPWEGFAKGGVVSGYFNNPQKFAKAVDALENLKQAEGIYLTMNPVNPALLARANNRLKVLDTTTQDQQAVCHRWLLIDTDPKRPSGISASEDELQAGIKRRDDIVQWLSGNGFPSPFKAMSGNGGHALYSLEDLPNTEEITNLKRDALKVLNHRFGRNGVDVDEAVFNPSRIMKLYGTTARKGEDIPERPHRKSHIEEIPDPIKPVTLEQLKWLAAQRPEEKRKAAQPKSTSNNDSLGPMDVGRYLDHYGVGYKIKQEATRTVYGLDHCLFNADHTRNEASIIQTKDGRLYYQCFHNECKNAGYRWQDARQKISGDEKIAQFCEGYKPRKKKSKTRAQIVSTGFHLTDMGNAERLVNQHGKDLRYCHPWHKWLVWDGKCWKIDDTASAKRMAKEMVRTIYAEAGQAKDSDEAKSLAKHAMRSEADTKIKAMLSVAESEPGIPVLHEDLDTDPWLLNCANTTIELKTGATRPHSRADLITKMAPGEFNAGAMCPAWYAFLKRIMDGNETLMRFLQRAVGYSLTGNTSERVIFILYGRGANGKSTFIQTINALLGDYAQQTPMQTFLLKRGESIPNDVAALRGSRFVSAVESERGRRMAESLVKWLTGRDTITARFMRAEYFSFMPTFKIWLGTNHRPEIRGTDEAIWDRIRLIPFDVRIPKDEQDPNLLEKLKTELPGILIWGIEGCLAWQEQGLGMPEEIKAATDSYRQDMDVLSGFFEDKCFISGHLSVTKQELFEAYKIWCEEDNEKPVGKKRFGQLMKERGFQDKKAGHCARWCWEGIGLLTENDSTLPPVSEGRADISNGAKQATF